MNFISQPDYIQFQNIFTQNSQNNRIPVTACQSILMKSGLSPQLLGRIWDLAISSDDITFPDFALAMFLTKTALAGYELPTVLPPHIMQQVKFAKQQVPIQMNINNTGYAGINPQMTGSTPISHVEKIPQLTGIQNSQLFSGYSNYSNLHYSNTMIGANQNNWAISADEKARFDVIFQANDPENLGYISGDVARKVFSQSGLRENMLAHIWQLSDMQNRGKLNSDEFAVAMHLIFGKLNGHDLPSQLPPNLIPPSHKNLQDLSDLAKLAAIQTKPINRISPAASLASLNDQLNLPAPAVVKIAKNDSDSSLNAAIKAAETTVETENLQSLIDQSLRAAEDYKQNIEEIQKRAIETVTGKTPSIIDLSSLDVVLVGQQKIMKSDIMQKIADQRVRLSKTGIEDNVIINKSAQLLAERMAALGVKSAGPPVNSGPSEQEKKVKLAELNRIATKAEEIIERMDKLIAAQKTPGINYTKGDERVYLEGDGLTDPEAIKFVKILQTERANYESTKSKSPQNSAFHTSFLNSNSTPAPIPETTINAAVVDISPSQSKPISSATAEALKAAQAALEKARRSSKKFEAESVLTFAKHDASRSATSSPVNQNVLSAKPVVVQPAISENNPFDFGNNISNLNYSDKSAPFLTTKIESVEQESKDNKLELEPFSAEAKKEVEESFDMLSNESYNGAGKTYINSSQSDDWEKLDLPANAPISEVSQVSITNQSQPTKDKTLSIKRSIELFEKVGKDNITQFPNSKTIPTPSELFNDIQFKSNDQSIPKETFDSTKIPPNFAGTDTREETKVSTKRSSSIFEKMGNAKITAEQSNIVPTPAQLFKDIKESKGTVPTPPPAPTQPLVSAIPNNINSSIDRKNLLSEIRGGAKLKSVSRPVPKPVTMNITANANHMSNITQAKKAIEHAPATFIEQPGPSNFFKGGIGDISSIQLESRQVEIVKNEDKKFVDGESDSPFGESESGLETFSPYKVLVEYDFNATQDDELTCLAGEFLTVLNEMGDWALCKNAVGESGLVPSAFFTKITEDEVVSQQVLSKATVLYNFESRNADELSIKEGEIVEIVSKELQDWFKIKLGDSVGLVPSSFLQEMYDRNSLEIESFENEFMDSSLDLDPFETSEENTDVFPNETESAGNIESKEEKKLAAAVAELISTEKIYSDQLQALILHFLQPMETMEIDTSVIFSNILEIVEVSKNLLQEFEKANSCREPVAVVFLQYLDGLEHYIQYCGEVDAATAALQRLREQNRAVADFLKNQRNVPGLPGLDLSSFLILPMQRITRYSLLFRQILHYTPKEDPSHDATLLALQMCEEFLDKLNASVRQKQSLRKMKELVGLINFTIPDEQYRLDLFQPTRTMGDRLFLFEGHLQKNKSRRKLRGYLFNDILIIAQPTPGTKPFGLYRKPLLLSSLSIRDAIPLPNKDTGPLDNCCFQIIFEKEILTFRATDTTVKKLWMNAIESAVQAVKSNTKKPVESGQKRRAAIGTLNVQFLSVNRTANLKAGNVFLSANVGDQSIKSKRFRTTDPFVKQSFIFTIFTIDDVLKLTLYNYSKYSADEFLGDGQIQLDFLEYYNGKETEIITVPVKDSPYFESINLKLMYRSA